MCIVVDWMMNISVDIVVNWMMNISGDIVMDSVVIQMVGERWEVLSFIVMVKDWTFINVVMHTPVRI